VVVVDELVGREPPRLRLPAKGRGDGRVVGEEEQEALVVSPMVLPDPAALLEVGLGVVGLATDMAKRHDGVLPVGELPLLGRRGHRASLRADVIASVGKG
jgi:hypothetical protein